MASLSPFSPGTTSSTIAVTSTSQSIAINGIGNNVYVANVGTKECFIKFGSSTVVAVAGGTSTAASDGSMSLISGFYGVLSRGFALTHIAAACAVADTTTLRITAGEGE